MLTTALLLLASAVLPSVAAPADSCEAEPTAPSLPQTGTGHELPPPRPGLRLKHIALGFGIQNYTCARPGAEATSTGALAMLYDITHLYPGQGPRALSADDFERLPAWALARHQVPLNLRPWSGWYASAGADAHRPFPPDAPLSLAGLCPLPFAGHHFFDAGGVPTFVLDGGRTRLTAAKLGSVDAPAAADRGPDDTGAVGWLYLGPKPDAVGDARYVYRVLTAGGVSHGCRAGAGDESNSYPGAGDESNSYPGAGDDSSSHAGAGDDSSSYAATYWFYG